MKLINIFTFLLLFSSCQNIVRQDEKTISPSLDGYWRKNCDDESSYIQINRTIDTAFIEVNSNQIYVTAKIIKEEKDDTVTLSFYLLKLNDLGNGGIRLHWNRFSKNKPIAKMDILKSAKAKLTWFGFYEVNKRVWQFDSELLPFKKNNQKDSSCDYAYCQ